MSTPSTLNCKQCGGSMRRHRWSSGYSRILLGLIVVVIALFLLFIPTIITALLGVLLLIYGLTMGTKRHEGWKCQSCSYFFETAPRINWLRVLVILVVATWLATTISRQ